MGEGIFLTEIIPGHTTKGRVAVSITDDIQTFVTFLKVEREDIEVVKPIVFLEGSRGQ
jgi:hypothetical protein